MMHMKDYKTKRVIAAVLAGMLVLAMVVPMAMYAFGW